MPSVWDLLDETEDVPRLLRRRAQDINIEDITKKASPGLLYTLGRLVGWPSRKVLETIVGRPEARGVDVLRKLGLITSRQPGFLGEVAGFGTEVALDPLMLVGGLGMTKAGRGAARAAGLLREAKVARSFERSSKLAGMVEEAARHRATRTGAIQELLKVRKELQGMGAERTLRPTWRAQAEAAVPQRAAISLGFPFTGIQRPIVRAPRLLGGLQALGGAAKALPGMETIRKLFQVPKTPKAEEALRYHAGEQVRALQSVKPEMARLEAAVPEMVEKAGVPREEFLATLSKARESLGQPKRMGRQAARFRAQAEAAEEEAGKGFLGTREARLAGRAKKYGESHLYSIAKVLARKQG